jgi:hypothetical protein
MNCPKCNSQIESTGVFCASCGVRLSAATALTPGQVSYEALESMFRANDWSVSKVEEEPYFRVEHKDSYEYMVRLQHGRQITFSMFWPMSDAASIVDLHQLSNTINVKTASTITAVLEYDSVGVDLAVTIPVLMDRAISFADLERHFFHAEREWDSAIAETDISKFLYNDNSEG